MSAKSFNDLPSDTVLRLGLIERIIKKQGTLFSSQTAKAFGVQLYEFYQWARDTGRTWVRIDRDGRVELTSKTINALHPKKEKHQ